jgi:hypothetical protein
MWTALPSSEYYARSDSPEDFDRSSPIGCDRLPRRLGSFLVHADDDGLGFGLLPFPGFPLRGSISAYHALVGSWEDPAGVSQVLKRFSPCMPSSKDPAKPTQPHQDGCFVSASTADSVSPLGFTLR